jgi:hypothetical protein
MNLAFKGPPDDGRPKLPGSLHVNRRLDRWLTLHADGTVTIRPGKVELGQGILTALAQIAADELDVALAKLRVQPAATPDSPDEAVTSGSLSVQESGMALRHACADARRICLSVVAQRTGVSPDDIAVQDGDFLAPDGRVLGSYGGLADAGLLAVEASPDALPKPAAARRIAGQSVARLDLPDKVFGAPRYLHDLRLPGMLHARVVRPPSRGAVLRDLRDGALPGDAAVLRDGTFVAILATQEHHAEAAAERVARRASWDEANTLPDDGALEAWLRRAPRDSSVVAENAAETPAPAHRVSAAFLRPFLAHGAIGPSCAVARWDGATMEIWSHSQGIFNLRADLAKALRLPAAQIVVRHVEGSGCYGHNGADDVALDAALVARAHPHRPIRLLWTRAEELGWSPVSPAMLVEIEAEADAGGTLLAWRQDVTSNGHSGRPGRGKDPTLLSASMIAEAFPVPLSINPPIAGGGGAQRNAVPPYRVPTLRVGLHSLTEMPIRASALRGLGALANVCGTSTMRARATCWPMRRGWPAGTAARSATATASGWRCRGTRAPAPGAPRSPRSRRPSASSAAASGLRPMWARRSTPTASATRSRAARSRRRPCACSKRCATTRARSPPMPGNATRSCAFRTCRRLRWTSWRGRRRRRSAPASAASARPSARSPTPSRMRSAFGCATGPSRPTPSRRCSDAHIGQHAVRPHAADP